MFVFWLLGAYDSGFLALSSGFPSLFFCLSVWFADFGFLFLGGFILSGVWVTLALDHCAVGPGSLIVWSRTCPCAILILRLGLIIAMTFISSYATFVKIHKKTNNTNIVAQLWNKFVHRVWESLSMAYSRQQECPYTTCTF